MTPELLAATQIHTRSIIIACLWLMGAVILLGVGLWYYRKYWLAPPGDGQSPAWTLDDLRSLHERGELSTEEYQRLRAVMIGSLRENLGKQTTAPRRSADATSWDWVAGQDESGGDFDVKKRPRG